MTLELALLAGQGQADQALCSLAGLRWALPVPKEAQGDTEERTLPVARPSELPSLAAQILLQPTPIFQLLKTNNVPF